MPGPVLLSASFALASRGRPRSSWLAAAALLALLAIPGVPYAERTCSDVPKPYTMDFCDEGGTQEQPFGAVVLLGRAYGHGDLGSLTWRAPWWAVGLAGAWLVAFAAVACRWRPAAKAPHP